MKKLKQGEKVQQQFVVDLKFTAVEGDTPFTAWELKEYLQDFTPESSIPVKVVVEELK